MQDWQQEILENTKDEPLAKVFTMEVIDALGNEIVVGNYYGYSKASNGINTIHFGKVVKITPKGLVSIKVEYSKRGAYSGAEFTSIPDRAISVKPILIFPINIDDLKK
jgi:hypothetical protein